MSPIVIREMRGGLSANDMINGGGVRPLHRVLRSRVRGSRGLAAVLSASLLGGGLVLMSPLPASATAPAVITRFAGTGAGATPVNGPALSSTLDYPWGMTLDSSGNLYVSDCGNTVSKISLDGTLTVVAGTGTTGAAIPGPATSSPLDCPMGLGFDASGNLYIAGWSNHQVYKVTPGGTLSVFAGSGVNGAPVAGAATSSPMRLPAGIAVDSAGNVYVSDDSAQVISKITPSGTLSIVAGTGASGNAVPGPALSSPLRGPIALALDASGNLYSAEEDNNNVIKIDTSGTLSVVAGIDSTQSGAPTPGPAAASRLHSPQSVSFDAAGNLYIADGSNANALVEKVDTSGTLSIVVGTGVSGAPTYGAAPTTSQIQQTESALMGSDGLLYVSDSANNTIDLVGSLPDAPTGLSLTPGDTTAALTFTAPVVGSGVGNIRRYEVSTDSGATWTSLATTAGSGGTRTATVTGLVNGTTYTVGVRAVNATGTGPASATGSVVPAVPAPPASGQPIPAPTGASSTGIGAAPQHAHVTLAAGQSITLLDHGLEVSTVTVAGVGVYTLNAATADITFTPAAGYSGTPAGVTFRVTNASGSATAQYIPTVSKPPVPAPSAVSSSGAGVQHATVALRSGDVLALLDAAGTPVTTPVTITGEGTYTLDSASGVITFTPAAGFSGTGVGVGFQVTDAYGQIGMAAYVPTVATTPPPTATPTPNPTPTPVLKPLPKINRTGLAKIPADPDKVTGKKHLTKAYNSSYAGIDANPIVKLGARRLAKGQATTPSGDGLFDFDKATLTRSGRAQVKAVVLNLQRSKAVNCEGYTDYAGVRSHELALSADRAKAVCTALKMYGAKITTKIKGYGPARPVAVGGTAKARKENRRVVILVTK